MDGQSQTTERIEQYLSEVSRHLVYMPPAEATETRDELRQHIYALVAELRAGGASEEDAITAGLKKFGTARRVGRQLGAKSVKEFLRGIEQGDSVHVRWNRKFRGVLSLICFIPSGWAFYISFVPTAGAFYIGDHREVWPFCLALVGGVVVGLLEGFDRPQPSDQMISAHIPGLEKEILRRASNDRTWRGSFKRFLAAQTLKSIRNHAGFVQPGSARYILNKLDLNFYLNAVTWAGIALLMPSLRNLLGEFFLWSMLWWTGQIVAAIIARKARDRFALNT